MYGPDDVMDIEAAEAVELAASAPTAPAYRFVFMYGLSYAKTATSTVSELLSQHDDYKVLAARRVTLGSFTYAKMSIPKKTIITIDESVDNSKPSRCVKNCIHSFTRDDLDLFVYDYEDAIIFLESVQDYLRGKLSNADAETMSLGWSIVVKTN
jgi:hypothetical protein